MGSDDCGRNPPTKCRRNLCARRSLLGQCGVTPPRLTPLISRRGTQCFVASSAKPRASRLAGATLFGSRSRARTRAPNRGRNAGCRWVGERSHGKRGIELYLRRADLFTDSPTRAKGQQATCNASHEAGPRRYSRLRQSQQLSRRSRSSRESHYLSCWCLPNQENTRHGSHTAMTEARCSDVMSS